MNYLKKFNQSSDAPGVNFVLEGLLMTLNSQRKGQEGLKTLSVLIGSGDTAVLHRIANNVTEDQDEEEIFNEWVRNNGGSIDKISGTVYANHNILGLGRPIILNEDSVQIEKGLDDKWYVVSRFARWYPEGKKGELTADLMAANESLIASGASIKEDMKLFKELDDTDNYKKVAAEYQLLRKAISINSARISCLQTPYIAGTSFAKVSTDEAEVKAACKNSGLDFAKMFPNGLAGGLNEAPEENEATAATPATVAETPAQRMNAEVTAEA
jgi:hypothetical protein